MLNTNTNFTTKGWPEQSTVCEAEPQGGARVGRAPGRFITTITTIIIATISTTTTTTITTKLLLYYYYYYH